MELTELFERGMLLVRRARRWEQDTEKSVFIKENIDETIFMFALFKCGKSDKGRN